jgi:uncharacterized membrane protein YphA (DoxX/SURF4 family)
MEQILARLPAVARTLLGLIFFVFGLNFFFHFLPQPPMPEQLGQFVGGLVASGFVMPVVKTIEVTAGALLLSNRFVPLALALLAPIVVAIVGTHAVLAPAGLGLALTVLALELYLARVYRNAFAPMLAARVQPSVPAHSQHKLSASPAE